MTADQTMTYRLSSEEFDLLRELNKRGGKATISDAKPHGAAVRLIASGFATSRALNLSTVEYEITSLGRTLLVLADSSLGRHDPLALTIEPHQLDVDGIWYIKVRSAGNPTDLISISSAIKVAAQLRATGVNTLADRFETEIGRTRRYAGVG